jgi:periplasmic copper chaperone A
MFLHALKRHWYAVFLVGLCFVLPFWMAACTLLVTQQPALTGDALRIEKARARVAAEGHNSAVYLTIVNPTEQADRLLSAETGAARTVELHESIEQEGVVRMQPHPEGFEIPARAITELAPGGKHLMLLNLTEALAEGDTITVTLYLAEAGAIDVTATVTAEIRGQEHQH